MCTCRDRPSALPTVPTSIVEPPRKRDWMALPRHRGASRIVSSVEYRGAVQVSPPSRHTEHLVRAGNGD